MCSYLTAGAGSLEMAGNWKMAACPAFTVTSAAGGGANALISEIKKDIKRVKPLRNKVHRVIIGKRLRGTQIIINSRWYQLDRGYFIHPSLEGRCNSLRTGEECSWLQISMPNIITLLLPTSGTIWRKGKLIFNCDATATALKCWYPSFTD